MYPAQSKHLTVSWVEHTLRHEPYNEIKAKQSHLVETVVSVPFWAGSKCQE